MIAKKNFIVNLYHKKEKKNKFYQENLVEQDVSYHSTNDEEVAIELDSKSNKKHINYEAKNSKEYTFDH